MISRVLAAVALAAACAGCASRTDPVARPSGAEHAAAATPAAAALGFAKSLRNAGAHHTLQYACLAGSGSFSYVGIGEHAGSPKASVVRAGADWDVTVAYPEDPADADRFRVRRYPSGGYCVSQLLPRPGSRSTEPIDTSS